MIWLMLVVFALFCSFFTVFTVVIIRNNIKMWEVSRGGHKKFMGILVWASSMILSGSALMVTLSGSILSALVAFDVDLNIIPSFLAPVIDFMHTCIVFFIDSCIQWVVIGLLLATIMELAERCVKKACGGKEGEVSNAV